MASALQKAEMDRSLLEVDVSRLEKKLATNVETPLCKETVETSIRRAAELDKGLVEIHRRIMYQSPAPEDLTNHTDKYVEISDRINEVNVKLLKLKSNFTSSASSSSDSTSSNNHSDHQSSVRLPMIELPSFEGNFAEWTSFADIFKATVSSRSDLSEVQKLQYLKASTKKEAADLIKSLYVTTENFAIAWKILEERYHNEREIAQSLMKRLFSQPHLHKESASAIQKMMDTTNECLRSLAVMKRPTDKWDDVIIFMMVERLDSETRKQWALRLTGTTIPSLQELLTFLEQYCRGLQATSSNSVKTNGQEKRFSSSHFSMPNKGNKCAVCKQGHSLYFCPTFKSYAPEERNKVVKQHKFCPNCLRADHSSARECKSDYRCKHCNAMHHTLLHYNRQSQPAVVSSHVTACSGIGSDNSYQPLNGNGQWTQNKTGVVSMFSTTTSDASTFSSIHKNTQVLLGTMLANVQDSMGNLHQVRVLLDSASGCTMITENCARALGLSRHHSNIVVNGVGGAKAGHSRGEVNLTLLSRIDNNSINIQALVFGHITNNVPDYFIQNKQWSHLNGLKLADPEYFKPGHVDILLDADYTELIMLNGKRRGPRFSPKASNSKFGWILSGRVKGETFNITANHVHCELESLVKKFWQIEQLPDIIHLTPEQQFVEEHFRDTFQRNKSGRFIVKLPFNKRLDELGASRDMAIRRFLQVEKRLSKNEEVRKEYVAFMQEYEALGHMEEISSSKCVEIIGKTNYLPHHFVVKSDSTTTKLRVVFDASAKTTTGLSLNDTLSVGATVQNDLFTILLKFRFYPIIIKADIAKMFRQFLVDEKHCDFQRIVWRESTNQPIKHYRLKTTTYGISSSPFLATRCLKQLALENMNKFPLASSVLNSSTYVDDSITGVTSLDRGIKLVSELNQVCSSAGLTLRKFCSNNLSVLCDIPADLRETETSFDLDKSGGIKALGVKWITSSDQLLFSVNMHHQPKTTKRLMLSELAKVFDPLGLISPATVVGKILFQKVWKVEGLTWESVVPSDIDKEWQDYKRQLVDIENCMVNRCVLPEHKTYIELHGFSDASEAAYGAVVYFRYRDHNGKFKSNMITSKVRVAPLKRLSIERLELCGAALLSELMSVTIKTFNLNCPIFAWTDSTIVLKYLAAHPSRWKTFVAHKVAKIQEEVPPEHWKHVRGSENPADLISRGVPAQRLISSSLWWQGPGWLSLNQLPSSLSVPALPTSVKLEEKKKVLLAAHVSFEPDILSKFSSLTKLKRVTAFVLRFVRKTRKLSTESGPLTPVELRDALYFWIQRVQAMEFASELKHLQSKQQLKKKSSILSLTPFLDDNGIIRVGGRLRHANLPDYVKHQVIIPHSSHLSQLIIRHFHWNLYHAGFQSTWTNIQQEFWITRARATVKKVIRSCVVCRRHKAIKNQQLMGALPAARVTMTHPFQNTGVDYAGPFQLITTKGRGGKVVKGYLALFVCFCTKAVHLEAVSDLTTEAFIAALKRFISRRGVCANLFSDCGTNFIGAERELKTLVQSSTHHNKVADHLSTIGMKWTFNTPGSPHQGGLWEAGVKSVKHHFRRVVGDTRLTFEEFQTVLCQIEGILNSRPLCGASTDSSDLLSLTPGHFIIGRPLTALPDPDVTNIKVNRLSRWQLCQQITQHFWKRWRNEYLQSLQQRFKWCEKRSNLAVGDLVLLNDENLPPTKWKLGRVINVKPSKDGCVRVVNIKTSTGEYERSITKLTPLLCNDDKE